MSRSICIRSLQGGCGDVGGRNEHTHNKSMTLLPRANLRIDSKLALERIEVVELPVVLLHHVQSAAAVGRHD